MTLEHVTQNEIIDDDKKTTVADELLDEWEDNLNGLLEIFMDKGIADSVHESWKTLSAKKWYYPYSNINNLAERVTALVDETGRSQF